MTTAETGELVGMSTKSQPRRKSGGIPGDSSTAAAEASDLQLIRGAELQHHGALAEIYRRHARAVFATAEKVLRPNAASPHRRFVDDGGRDSQPIPSFEIQKK